MILKEGSLETGSERRCEAKLEMSFRLTPWGTHLKVRGQALCNPVLFLGPRIHPVMGFVFTSGQGHSLLAESSSYFVAPRTPPHLPAPVLLATFCSAAGFSPLNAC